jgi:hypothetical protein
MVLSRLLGYAHTPFHTLYHTARIDRSEEKLSRMAVWQKWIAFKFVQVKIIRSIRISRHTPDSSNG